MAINRANPKRIIVLRELVVEMAEEQNFRDSASVCGSLNYSSQSWTVRPQRLGLALDQIASVCLGGGKRENPEPARKAQ
jgi:hypothetical protein